MIRPVLPPFAARRASWLIHAVAPFVRPLTMGVRAVVLDPEEHVFLVRHSYLPGWHLPGGGIEPGETAREAMAREVREEAGLRVTGEAALHGLFFNRGASRRDHVAVYVVRAFEALASPPPDWEIVERGFFEVRALPPGTTEATRARLAEVLDGVPPAELW